jgi:hypothetical protein
MSDFFTINDIPDYDKLGWTVTWPGRGVVHRQRYKMLEFAAQSGDWRVGFCTEKECASVDTNVLLGTNWEPEMLDHLFKSSRELAGIAFTERQYAERFVKLAEQHIAWNLLKRRAEEHN